jgi:hypothetical protein
METKSDIRHKLKIDNILNDTGIYMEQYKDDLGRICERDDGSWYGLHR